MVHFDFVQNQISQVLNEFFFRKILPSTSSNKYNFKTYSMDNSSIDV